MSWSEEAPTAWPGLCSPDQYGSDAGPKAPGFESDSHHGIPVCKNGQKAWITETSRLFARWLTRHWVSLALVLGLLLLLPLPILIYQLKWNPYLVLVYLQTPIYMLHQVEEHTRDRLRTFLNRQIFHGIEAVTPVAVLWVNIPGVWAITFASTFLAAFVAPGWGLVGVYLIAVNGAAHLVWWVRLRMYNPGLWTGILFFVPLSVFSIWKSAGTGATWENHLVGLAVAIGIHAWFMIHTQHRARRLRLSTPYEAAMN